MITSNSSNYMILIISNKSNNNDNQTFESFKPEAISHTRQLTVTKDGDSSQNWKITYFLRQSKAPKPSRKIWA